MKVNLFDLLDIYETEVKKNVRNKKIILDFEKHKMEYLVDIKNVLENNLYNLLENCIRANINKGNIRNKYQNEMLVSINLLDFYIGEALDKKIIKKNRFNSFVNAINEIRKMTISWSIYEEKV